MSGLLDELRPYLALEEVPAPARGGRRRERGRLHPHRRRQRRQPEAGPRGPPRARGLRRPDGRRRRGGARAAQDLPAEAHLDGHPAARAWTGCSSPASSRRTPPPASIIIIALTAYAMKGDDLKMLAAGCDGYVTKPIDLDALPALVAEHLSGRRRMTRMSAPAILIVEDNAITRKLFRVVVEGEGFVALEAASGAEALEQMEVRAVAAGAAGHGAARHERLRAGPAPAQPARGHRDAGGGAVGFLAPAGECPPAARGVRRFSLQAGRVRPAHRDDPDLPAQAAADRREPGGPAARPRPDRRRRSRAAQARPREPGQPVRPGHHRGRGRGRPGAGPGRAPRISS